MRKLELHQGIQTSKGRECVSIARCLLALGCQASVNPIGDRVFTELCYSKNRCEQ